MRPSRAGRCGRDTYGYSLGAYGYSLGTYGYILGTYGYRLDPGPDPTNLDPSPDLGPKLEPYTRQSDRKPGKLAPAPATPPLPLGR